MNQEGLMFPKKKTKKKKMKHPKSIMHDRLSKTCYLCMLLNGNWGEKTILEEHHIFGGPDRELSEKYGLKIYLCPNHHTMGPDAIHTNQRHMLRIQRLGQQAFQMKYPNEDFTKIFRKNYIG